MPSSPSAAIHQHLDAVNAADRELLQATTTFPLFQGGGDGAKHWYLTADEVPFPLPPNRLELVSEETWATTGDLSSCSLSSASSWPPTISRCNRSKCSGRCTATGIVGR